MKVVWKYSIGLLGHTFLKMPVGSKILAIGVQSDKPVIWIEVSAEAMQTERQFIVVPTGMQFDDNFNYVGSFTIPDRDDIFVGHIYEVVK